MPAANRLKSRRAFLREGFTASLCSLVMRSGLPSLATVAARPQPPGRRISKFAAQPIRPTAANVPYGSHPRQVLDFWNATSARPTPLVLAIHGGGWTGMDKSTYGSIVPDYLEPLKAGISVASINYRFITEAMERGIVPPVTWPLHDAARALQFIRSQAHVWNIDESRIGATGFSAGGTSALWLAFHEDLADQNSKDPVARESTRLFCVAARRAQTTLDPLQLREWIPNFTYGSDAFGIPQETDKAAEFQKFFAARERLLPLIKEYSPISHVSRDSPPVFLEYPARPVGRVTDDPPLTLRKGQAQADPTHSALLGVLLMEALQAADVDAILVYPGRLHNKYQSCSDFLIDRLGRAA
jgi:acetyl esterase/lipase